MKEIKSLRKAREKHFLNKDGTITAYLYDSDIHYLKDGVYEEIDNSIVNNKDKLVNTKNAFKSSFSKDVKNNNLVDIKDNISTLEVNDLKTDLVNFMGMAEMGAVTEEQKIRGHELYDKYREKGGNSYIHDQWEKLKKEGKL